MTEEEIKDVSDVSLKMATWQIYSLRACCCTITKKRWHVLHYILLHSSQGVAAIIILSLKPFSLFPSGWMAPLHQHTLW